jgi:hypothetical protein
VLKPGARLVNTTWDYDRQPIGRPPQVPDHRPLLEDAGFSVIAYDEPEGWRSSQTRLDELLIEAVDELAEESGMSKEELRASLEEMHATLECVIRRVFAVAELRI